MASQNHLATRAHAKNSDRADGLAADTGSRLDAVVSFVTENWKEILGDIVTAGVTAFLEYNSREKTKSENTSAVRTASKH